MELDQDRPQIHLPALPHTDLTRAYDWCAYTAKLRRFTHTLVKAGYTPVVYGPERHECAEGTIYEPIVSAEDKQRWFGTPEWDSAQVFDQWDADTPPWREMNLRAAVAIATHWRDGDIVGLISGRCQELIPRTLIQAGLTPTVWEWGIGYSGIIPWVHHTFESHAWAHHVAGLQHDDNVRFFDSVVPNCYDLAEFTPSETVGDYLLFMGRPTARKGLQVIAEIGRRTDIPLKIAGQPGFEVPGAEHVGLVTGQAKAELLAGARAVLVPTTYLEPFGGVAVEAMLSGTPVITTDWGAFTETVAHGISGFRCHTLAEFVDAVDRSAGLNRKVVHMHAAMRYTLDQAAEQYDAVIQRLITLRGEGWYQL